MLLFDQSLVFLEGKHDRLILALPMEAEFDLETEGDQEVSSWE